MTNVLLVYRSIVRVWRRLQSKRREGEGGRGREGGEGGDAETSEQADEAKLGECTRVARLSLISAHMMTEGTNLGRLVDLEGRGAGGVPAGVEGCAHTSSDLNGGVGDGGTPLSSGSCRGSNMATSVRGSGVDEEVDEFARLPSADHESIEVDVWRGRGEGLQHSSAGMPGRVSSFSASASAGGAAKEEEGEGASRPLGEEAGKREVGGAVRLACSRCSFSPRTSSKDGKLALVEQTTPRYLEGGGLSRGPAHDLWLASLVRSASLVSSAEQGGERLRGRMGGLSSLMRGMGMGDVSSPESSWVR